MALNPERAMQFLMTLGVIGLILHLSILRNSHGNLSTVTIETVCSNVNVRISITMATRLLRPRVNQFVYAIGVTLARAQGCVNYHGNKSTKSLEPYANNHNLQPLLWLRQDAHIVTSTFCLEIKKTWKQTLTSLPVQDKVDRRWDVGEQTGHEAGVWLLLPPGLPPTQGRARPRLGGRWAGLSGGGAAAPTLGVGEREAAHGMRC